jgi:hypothetical protein
MAQRKSAKRAGIRSFIIGVILFRCHKIAKNGKKPSGTSVAGADDVMIGKFCLEGTVLDEIITVLIKHTSVLNWTTTVSWPKLVRFLKDFFRTIG